MDQYFTGRVNIKTSPAELAPFLSEYWETTESKEARQGSSGEKEVWNVRKRIFGTTAECKSCSEFPFTLHIVQVACRCVQNILASGALNIKKNTQWPESASVLYRPSDLSLSGKLMPTFADRRVSRSQHGGSPYSRFSRSGAATFSLK
jgi:hypothetical protein